jgi:ApaG protein
MTKTDSYNAVTRGIAVSVKPVYLDDQSDPDEARYVWAYHVEITNNSDHTVQLQRRYWRITDALGRVQEVRGEGVVGEQPEIEPGETFEYTSGTPLTTSSGMMVGTYEMERAEGDTFEVDIPAFSLDCPFEKRQLN